MLNATKELLLPDVDRADTKDLSPDLAMSSSTGPPRRARLHPSSELLRPAASDDGISGSTRKGNYLRTGASISEARETS